MSLINQEKKMIRRKPNDFKVVDYKRKDWKGNTTDQKGRQYSHLKAYNLKDKKFIDVYNVIFPDFIDEINTGHWLVDGFTDKRKRHSIVNEFNRAKESGLYDKHTSIDKVFHFYRVTPLFYDTKIGEPEQEVLEGDIVLYPVEYSKADYWGEYDVYPLIDIIGVVKFDNSLNDFYIETKFAFFHEDFGIAQSKYYFEEEWVQYYLDNEHFERLGHIDETNLKEVLKKYHE